AQYIVVRGDLYERLGGFDCELARFGDHAVVLDFLERALGERFAIGYRETPGLSPAGVYRPARSLLEWRRWAAAAALLALAAPQAAVDSSVWRLAALERERPEAAPPRRTDSGVWVPERVESTPERDETVVTSQQLRGWPARPSPVNVGARIVVLFAVFLVIAS